EADRLRQAMSAKRAPERIEELRQRLLDGMAERGIGPAVAEDIYVKILAFSNYGFPESHAISFAYLVYASAWLKRYYPAAFTAALLRNQPMGFYAPHSLINDARRHGVTVRGVDVNASDAPALLARPGLARPGLARPSLMARPGRPSGSACPPSATWAPRRPNGSRLAAPTGTWRTSPAGRACRPRRSRRWPPRARSAVSGSAGAPRCGRPGPQPRSARDSCPALPPG